MLRGLLLLLILVGCQHPAASSDLAQEGNCDAAFNEIPWEVTQIKFAESSKQIVGAAASYTASGLGYLTDGFVYLGEGTFKNIFYCPYFMVALAASAASNSGGLQLAFCGEKQVKINGSRLGNKIYYRTKNFRKQDYDRISEINRIAAGCYARKGGAENTHLAAAKLEPLAKDDDFLKNLSVEERDKLATAYSGYSEADRFTTYNLQLVLSHNDKTAKKNIWLVQETKKVTAAETLVPGEDKNWSQDKAWKFDEASPKELLKEHFDEVEKVTRQIYVRSRIIKGSMNASAVVLAIQYQILRANKIILTQTFTLRTDFGSRAAMDVGSVSYFIEGSEEKIKEASETVTVTVTPRAL